MLLLERGTRGLTDGKTGQGLLEHVRATGQAAMQLSLAVTGQSTSLQGDVCIATTNGFATFHLPRILKRQGLGVTILTRDVEDLFPEIQRVLPDQDPMPVPIWLVTHRELRASQRIRAVFDVLEEEIRKFYR